MYELTIKWAHGEEYQGFYHNEEPYDVLCYAQIIIAENKNRLKKERELDKSKPLSTVTKLEVRIIQ